MNNKMKFRKFVGAALVFSIAASGCSAKDDNSSSTDKSQSSSVSQSDENMPDRDSSATSVEPLAAYEYSSDLSAIFSDRDISAEYDTTVSEISLNGSSVSIDGDGAVCSGTEINITGEGTYIISGTLDDGKIIVNSVGKVQLVLDNADITCSDSAPIYVEAADKVFVTMADGTENTLTDSSSYIYADESVNEPDAVIFSHDSLTLNGSGTLNINANYNEGVTCKDDIVIAGCTLNITSVGNGIKGKDYVAVSGAAINVDSQEDGIKSTNIEDADMGFVYIKDGTINITAQEDGIQTDTEFISEGGTINIVSGGGVDSAAPIQNNDFGVNGGRGDWQGWNETAETETTEEDTTISTKGIKGAELIYISGGTFNIDSADDTLHSNGAITINGGEITMKSGDDGIHADSQINIDNGSVIIAQSYEGIEAADIAVGGGTVDVTSSDDAFNASDGTAQGAMGTYSDASLVIHGGTVYVDSGGDGLDSNGDMTISDGMILVNGPTNSGNGALDGNSEIICNGGLLIAAGSSGMAEVPSNSSSQYSVSASLGSTQSAGTLVTLCDEDGNEISSFAPSKTFDHIVISSPEIESGKTYTIYIGGSSSSAETHGYYEVGGYNEDGTEAGSFTAESTISYIGSEGMMGGGFGGGNFGGGGFGGGSRGDHGDFEIPTNENGEIEMPNGEVPEMPQGGFGGEMIEPPTGEDGMPEMPEDFMYN